MSHINEPDPSRLIHGLRDTGYNINSAAADIVDNCIAAGATLINVRTELQPNGAKIVYFGDNGHGMNAEGVIAAMRYGADKRENLKSLGKFGLGLKTASSSICLKYSLVSRDQVGAELSKGTWDLDHVSDCNAWDMIDEAVTPDEDLAFDELCGETGTLVIWQKCDRLLPHNDSYDPGSSGEKKALKRLAGRVAEHFGLVYHKYLEPKNTDYSNIQITVDGEIVEPWNPFYPEKSEQVLTEKQQSVQIAKPDNLSQTYPMGIRAWVLPHRKDLSKDEQALAKITNRGQGFYIYREGRLIQHGGWQEIWNAAEPHYSLIRVEINFDHELDDAFEIDVRKSRIIMDEALKEYLTKLLGGPREYANKEVYRRKQKDSVSGGINHSGANRTIEDTKAVKKPSVTNSNAATGTTTVNNNIGNGITVKAPVLNDQDPKNLSVKESDEIDSGNLWEPSFVSSTNSDHQVGVRINKKHDFYSKIYSQAGSQNSIEGMDLLLFALASAETNNTDDELSAIWEDIRDEVSSNLKKLLRSYELPAD